MTILEAIILVIIQGFAEFLPISSSGHLAVAGYLFGLDDGNLLFIIVVHVGTLIPVCIVYRKALWELIKRPFQKMTLLLILGTIPAGVVGVFFSDIVESALASMAFLAFGFIVTGTVLIISDRMAKKRDASYLKSYEQISHMDSIIVGIAQACAVFPGISRSGSTIAAALSRGIARDQAAKFVFLLSIPAILGGLVIYIARFVSGQAQLYDVDFIVLGAGFVASGLSGYLAINFMLAAIKKAKLRYFAFYVIGLAAVIGVYLLVS